MSEIVPFTVDIADSALDDLHRRLGETRWPDQLPGAGWDYGAEMGYIQELARYWAGEYDWRAAEAELNRLDHYTTTIDGQNIHFIHQRSPHPGAYPLIISHGWPGSVVEFLDIIDLLTDPEDPADAFHVVAPSLPGYGFSGPTADRGWDTVRTAGAFATLMGRLGYQRYGAQGGDWGSFISQNIGRGDPDHCEAVHVNFLFTPAPGDGPGDLTEAEQGGLDRTNLYFTQGSGYMQIQSTKPQTLAYGLTDSPAGQLAWIAEKFLAWTDNDGSIESAVSRDRLLTNVSLYWFTATAGSSARMYYEMMHSGGAGLTDYLATPIGVANFPMEILQAPRRWLEPRYNIVHWTDMAHGGHFAAMEEPDALARDIRTFFRRFR
ncbi:epoxide hydrolase family protein [Candidatus Poriferisocius sp.]|uniref:epoxide hydrolase family protein n=1 Tax=Candidatus Poriferisocius sp. TaxID=3101276 RepID=UPI003B0293D6